jgi:2-phospho-L-lactate transferase/gluconeogenesis factor (CofD/UPF0052 family)
MKRCFPQVFQYRFTSGGGLEGHSLGNLFITASVKSPAVLKKQSRSPAGFWRFMDRYCLRQLSNVELVGDVQEHATQEIVEVRGEAQLTEYPGKILKVWIDPEESPAYPPTTSAILDAI